MGCGPSNETTKVFAFNTQSNNQEKLPEPQIIINPSPDEKIEETENIVEAANPPVKSENEIIQEMDNHKMLDEDLGNIIAEEINKNNENKKYIEEFSVEENKENTEINKQVEEKTQIEVKEDEGEVIKDDPEKILNDLGYNLNEHKVDDENDFDHPIPSIFSNQEGMTIENKHSEFTLAPTSLLMHPPVDLNDCQM